MKSNQIFDYTIVGQGIAGSVLALALASRGLKVMVINEEKANTSSKIAAGLLNPVTGFRKKKAWLADIVYPALHEFYLKQEKVLGQQFYFPQKLFIPFDSIQSQNVWISKSGDQNWSSYIEISELPDLYKNKIIQPYGGMCIKQAGWVDIPTLLEATKTYFTQKEAYSNQKIEYSQLQITENIAINNIVSKKVIFCEGTAAQNNPILNWIPFVPNKGEILDLSIDGYPTDYILNKGVFLLPTANGIFRCGSTYYNEFEDSQSTTEEGAQEIMSKFLNLVGKIPAEIVGHRANIRPSVLGRRPVIGSHPKYPNIGIFNGFGSKGASLTPYFAEVLLNHFEHNMPILKEADCKRFWPSY